MPHSDNTGGKGTVVRVMWMRLHMRVQQRLWIVSGFAAVQVPLEQMLSARQVIQQCMQVKQAPAEAYGRDIRAGSLAAIRSTPAKALCYAVLRHTAGVLNPHRPWQKPADLSTTGKVRTGEYIGSRNQCAIGDSGRDNDRQRYQVFFFLFVSVQSLDRPKN